MPAAASYYNENKGKGLELWVVLGETADGLQPDLEYCMAYAESHGMNPENLYIDYNPEALNKAWDTLFSHIDSTTTNIGLPWEAVVEGAEMTYIWNSVPPDSGAAEQVLDGLLSE